MEADRVAVPFQYHALQIVVEQDTGNTIPRGKGSDVATQEVLHPCVEEEAQEDLARVAEHHDDAISGRRAISRWPKCPPIDLPLLAGQAAQAQIGFGFWTRPMAGDEMAEVIGTAPVASLAHHHIQAACRQRRECLQRLADERQIGVDPRLARWRTRPRQTGLRQHATDDAVMHVQLLGDGADQPLLRVVEAQYPRFDIRWRHHGRVPSGRVVAPIGDRRGDARTLDGTRSEQRRPHQSQREKRRRARSTKADASLAITSEPEDSKSSGGDGGEP